MDITFLSAAHPLTKTYSKQPDGTIEKTPYPDVYLVSSHLERVDSLEQFHRAVVAHAAEGHCLLKGALSRPLVNESRAGTTDSTGSTSWVCLDIDGLPTRQSIDEILLQLGIADTSYILQWSGSQGITSNDLRCHIFFMLDKPTPAPLLKQWLMQLNLTIPLLRDNMQLARSGNHVRWALDVTTCQNDKLIFIAPPELRKIRDPFRDKPRIQFVQKKRALLSLPAQINSVAINKNLMEVRKQELRDAAGLPPKKSSYRTVKDVEVLSRPDQAIITVARVGEQFTYLNLNDGDSCAYYYPNNSPEIIYNFKGEPNYLTRDLDPDYWKQVSSQLKHQQREDEARAAQEEAAKQIGASAAESGEILLAFRDRRTGIYYHGTYNEDNEDLDLSIAKNEKQIRDFCMQFDVPIGDYVPIWDLVFDPQDNVRVDVANRTINTFQRTEYMRAESKRVLKCPPTIFRVISHALGGEVNIIEHFINWLAFIVQNRTLTGTAWVLYGTEGTGKGMLMREVLRPMLGLNQTAFIDAGKLAEKYNQYLKDKLLVFYDEAHITEMRDAEGIMAKLRSSTTEPTISLRAMYSNAVEVTNYTNHILASNKPNVILLQPNDRRWNIGRFQHEKLILSDTEYSVLEEGTELQSFYHYLYNYPLDANAARTPLVTEDRQQLIDTTLSSADEVAAALNERSASMAFLLDQLPTDNSYMANAMRMNSVEDYRAVLLALLERTAPDGTCKIARDELRTIFEYAVGNIPSTPNKFTKFLAHRHIHISHVWIDRTVRGIGVKWKDAREFKRYLSEHFPIKAKSKVKNNTR